MAKTYFSARRERRLGERDSTKDIRIGLRFQKTLKVIRNFSNEDLQKAFDERVIENYPDGDEFKRVKLSKTDILAIQYEWGRRKQINPQNNG